MSRDLSLIVQYATPAPELPRWRLRRWVQHALSSVLMVEAEAGMPDRFRAASFTLRLVDADEGRRLNHEFRHKDYATNVLTFEYGIDPEGMASGDIVLCLPVLYREAAEQKKTILAHAAHLTVHGVLHALGYNHIDPEEATDMEMLEASILEKIGIANPYQETGG
ncbi:rRNA maturation RNase YbeY [Pollutimonas harenae]|uniref:Endoribonuclease YbeY n=1 Tax=Pollutimonas harenae TaxID=657015 RepID=A0A853GV16_9BURK|nr:rRNA maturation RNase YbeY [Pollutimonas harenae]NYT87018.1 rRNA maturation RNase YbeY [Pollutimonas harenae]TEA69257.1 rRNA maturation RNase YbeY [Pollutimonas harenae]